MASSSSVSKSSPSRSASKPAKASTPSRSTTGNNTTSTAKRATQTPTTAANKDVARAKGSERTPTPATDGAALSREAAAPEEEGASPGFLDALSANFGDVDADGDGHLTDAEIQAGSTNRELSTDARSALGALRGRQGAVEEFSNDEYFDENDGITTGDLGELEGHQSLDAQRIREEFAANRATLAENPDANFAPLPELESRSVAGHAMNIARHVGTPLIPGSAERRIDLAMADAGGEVDPNSRLGAYQATGGYREGTVGHSAHNAIGQIYSMAGTIGEDQIGTVFNSDAARALYNQPVNSAASRQLAGMEHAYWSQQQEQGTLGGHMGAAVSPETRDWLQRETFR
jgi:hypothetical protein